MFNDLKTLAPVIERMLTLTRECKESGCTPDMVYSNSELVDLFGKLKSAQAALAEVQAPIKDYLLTLDGNQYGDEYKTIATHTERRTLDGTRVRQELGDDWYADHTKVSSVSSVRCQRLDNFKV